MTLLAIALLCALALEAIEAEPTWDRKDDAVLAVGPALRDIKRILLS